MTNNPAHSTPRVMVVEDDKDLLKLYTKLLLTKGYDVAGSNDGKEAFEQLKRGGFDLVLLDIMLPNMDGLQILDELRKSPPKVPNKAVVLLTNLNQDDVIAKAVQFNVRGYMVKSDYTPDKFLTEVENILHGKE